MTTLIICGLLWLALSLPLAVLVGKCIKFGDEE